MLFCIEMHDMYFNYETFLCQCTLRCTCRYVETRENRKHVGLGRSRQMDCSQHREQMNNRQEIQNKCPEYQQYRTIHHSEM